MTPFERRLKNIRGTSTANAFSTQFGKLAQRNARSVTRGNEQSNNNHELYSLQRRSKDCRWFRFSPKYFSPALQHLYTSKASKAVVMRSRFGLPRRGSSFPKSLPGGFAPKATPAVPDALDLALGFGFGLVSPSCAGGGSF